MDIATGFKLAILAIISPSTFSVFSSFPYINFSILPELKIKIKIYIYFLFLFLTLFTHYLITKKKCVKIYPVLNTAKFVAKGYLKVSKVSLSKEKKNFSIQSRTV